MIELAAGVGLFGAASFAALWWRVRGDLHRARGEVVQARRAHASCAAVVDAAPLFGFRWSPASLEPAVLGRPPFDVGSSPYDAFVAQLDPSDAERLSISVEALRTDGKAFTASLSTQAPVVYQIDGRLTAAGEAVLWIADMSALWRAEAGRSAAAAEAGELRRMLDALPVPVWRRQGDDLHITECNAAFAAALDATRDAVIAGSEELLPEGGRAMARAAANEGAAHVERRHVVIAGSRHLLELAECPVDDGGTIGFALDLTDLETAESELSRHVNAHGQVLESIHAGVAIYGADKRLSFFNAAFARMWGIEEDWLAGEPSFDELLERLRERRRIPEYVDFRAYKRQQLAMFTSLIDPMNEMMHLPDDRTISVSISPHPLGGLIFIYEDVTDRLALERLYNTLIEVQRETLDNLFESIAVFGSDGRLKLHNPAYRKIWGLREVDLQGEPHFGEIVEKTRRFYDDGGDWPTIRDRVVATVTSQNYWTGREDRRDGSVLQLATVPLPDGNVLFTCLDVTDTARVERALRERNDALETADRLKSEFIANVSYELRTPLNAIIGFAEILANQYFGPLNPRQLDYSRGILDSSHRLMALINDILDLAMVEAGYMVLEPSRIVVSELLDAVLALTRERAQNQNVSISIDYDRDVGAIEADERRLKQALFNLVSNAIKYTPAGGAIRIGARAEAGDIVLFVSDTGIGIPAADQQRVFRKFERGNPQSRDSGAGLGLSLVKSLIELHGGAVAIESEPGAGTTVSCRLPSRLREAAVAEVAK